MVLVAKPPKKVKPWTLWMFFARFWAIILLGSGFWSWSFCRPRVEIEASESTAGEGNLARFRKQRAANADPKHNTMLVILLILKILHDLNIL